MKYGEALIIETPINDRYIITIPKKLRKILKTEIGDHLAFKTDKNIEGKNIIIVGVIKRTVIERNVKFIVDDKELR